MKYDLATLRLKTLTLLYDFTAKANRLTYKHVCDCIICGVLILIPLGLDYLALRILYTINLFDFYDEERCVYQIR